MSLDVSLHGHPKCVECGHEHECSKPHELWAWSGLTHNMVPMATAADIYFCCWMPAETCIEKAENLIEPLTRALASLDADPEKFKKLNPANGWGDYEGFVEFVRSYLAACKRYPYATVKACR